MLGRITAVLLLVAAPAIAQPFQVVTGAGSASPHVKSFDHGGLSQSFFACDPSFGGGVRVAAGDVNGDGWPDIITGPGAGGGPQVNTFSGTDLTVLKSFFAYDPSFTGGIYVAAGDINHDGIADIVTGPDAGGSPLVKVFSSTDGSTLHSFFAYSPTFTGGVRVAAGDVNGDGWSDIVSGPGPGAGPQIQVFSGNDLSVLRSFFAYDSSFTGGVYVAAGDVNHDGIADIVTGPGAGAGPHVKVFSGADGSEIRSVFAYDLAMKGGVRVAAGDVNGDGWADIVTAPGAGYAPDVRVYSGKDLSLLSSFFAYDSTFTGGVYVAAIPEPGSPRLCWPCQSACS